MQACDWLSTLARIGMVAWGSPEPTIENRRCQKPGQSHAIMATARAQQRCRLKPRKSRAWPHQLGPQIIWRSDLAPDAARSAGPWRESSTPVVGTPLVRAFRSPLAKPPNGIAHQQRACSWRRTARCRGPLGRDLEIATANPRPARLHREALGTCNPGHVSQPVIQYPRRSTS